MVFPPPAPAAPAAPAASPSGGVQETLQARQRLDEFLRRTAPPLYAGGALAGYGGPKLPPLPPTAQYGGNVNQPAQPARPGVPNMQPSRLFGGLLSPPRFDPRQPVQMPQQPRPQVPTGQVPQVPQQPAVEHLRTQPIPYNTPFMPQPYAMEAVGDHSIQRMNYGGRDVYRFEVRPGDTQPWDATNRPGWAANPNSRAEIRYTEGASAAKANSPYNATPTTGRVQYGLGINVSQWPTTPVIGTDGRNHDWATLLQFHPTDEGQTGGGMGGSFGGLAVHSGYIDAQGMDGRNFMHIPLEQNHWYDFKLDINWTDKDSGYVRIYDGDRLLGQYTGKTVTAPYTYLKQGVYRNGDNTQTGVVYQTPLRITVPR